MNIKLQNVGKRFERNWIFRNIEQEFKEGNKYAILGPNGSGKSTLLKAISGSLTITEGTIYYSSNNQQVKQDDIYKHVSIAAPYLDIPEEYSLEELISFHKTFKSIDITNKEIIAKLELEHTNDKVFKHFSSGMKQRVKLGLAILSKTSLLLLDEPCTALDAKSVQWYQSMIEEYALNKTVLVFSNNKEEEYRFCKETVRIGNN
jgi:ABC-type multidrug transport system ATPase subunit